LRCWLFQWLNWILPEGSTKEQVAGENKPNTKGGPKMPTFRWNSEHPYYQNGRLIKKVKTQQTISLSAMDCTVIGWNSRTARTLAPSRNEKKAEKRLREASKDFSAIKRMGISVK
jgi:hypothetical protein